MDAVHGGEYPGCQGDFVGVDRGVGVAEKEGVDVLEARLGPYGLEEGHAVLVEEGQYTLEPGVGREGLVVDVLGYLSA